MNTAIIIAQFILQYGLPAFQKIIELTSQKTEPTPEQWAAVWALAEKSYEDYIKAKP